MGLFAWVLVGWIAGLLANWILGVKDTGSLIINWLLGVAGAIAGGFLGSAFGLDGTPGLSLVSTLTAAGGSILLLGAHRVLRSRSNAS